MSKLRGSGMQTIDGYSSLSSLMAMYPELGVLQRFGKLNVQNLIYLQAELTQLDIEWKQEENTNQQRTGDQRYYARDWRYLSSRLLIGDNDQWKKWLQIREKLKEYSEFPMTIIGWWVGDLVPNRECCTP